MHFFRPQRLLLALVVVFCPAATAIQSNAADRGGYTGRSCSEVFAELSIGDSAGSAGQKQNLVNARVCWKGAYERKSETLWGYEVVAKCLSPKHPGQMNISFDSKWKSVVDQLKQGQRFEFCAKITSIGPNVIDLSEAEMISTSVAPLEMEAPKSPPEVMVPSPRSREGAIPSPRRPGRIAGESESSQPMQVQASRAERMKAFISEYLRANENKEIEKVLSFYAESVDYYARGAVSKSYIRKDKETFFSFFRSLNYTLADDLVITDTQNPDIKILTFTFSYQIQTQKKTIAATAKNTWTIANFAGRPTIIAEKQTTSNRRKSSARSQTQTPAQNQDKTRGRPQSELKRSLGAYGFSFLRTGKDDSSRYGFKLTRGGNEVYSSESFLVEPSVEFYNATPYPNCQTAATTLFSGGAHCCSTAVAVTRCDQKEHAFTISLEHTSGIEPLDLDKSGARHMAVRDWSFAYYNANDRLSLSFAVSPAFERLLVHDGTTWRADLPGKYARFYNDLLQQAEKEINQMRGERDADDAMVSLAVTRAYYALMAGRSEAETERVFNKDLPVSWKGVQKKVFSDIKEAVASFNPVENL